MKPRTRTPSDGSDQTYINFLSGFIENPIVAIDNLSNSFGESKRQFTITKNAERYEPIVDEYVIAIYDNRLLVPKVDFFIDGDQFIFLTAPLNGRFLSLYAIEAPVPSFGLVLLDMHVLVILVLLPALRLILMDQNIDLSILLK